MARPPEVAVTGVGCVTPLGPDLGSSWAGLLAGRRGLRSLSPEDLHGLPWGGGDVPWVGGPARASREYAGFADAMFPLLLSAADEACADATLDFAALDRTRVGCVVGTSKGGLIGLTASVSGCRTTADPRAWSDFPPHAASAAVARRFGTAGPMLSPVAACATGLVCVLRAAELIRDGLCDVVIAGSADASLHPAVLGSFRRMGVLSTRFPEPAAACRPFDAERDGFAVGEGAGVFVLERRGHAEARGVAVRAVVRSGAMLSDPVGLTAVDPRGETLGRAVTDALRRGGLTADDLGHLNLHGTGTRPNDAAEAAGLTAALSAAAGRIPAVALKGATGHLLGASGAVELAASVAALGARELPPTANLTLRDPSCDLAVSPHRQRLGSGAALKVSLGFGGHVVVACLAPP